MNKFTAALIAVLIWIICLVPSSAQFADQATAIQSVAGTNTITGTLPNIVSYADIVNVLMKLTPAGINTGSATINLNGIGASPIFKPSAAGLIPLTGGELVANQPVLLMLISGGNVVLLSVTSTTVAASNLANSALGFNMPTNLQLNASVGSNQLTIAVKGNNGADPSATNPVLFPFRDTTIANGDPIIVSLQAALGFTIGSGSTMGCVSGQMCRLWVVAFNNAGTVQLCAFNALSGRSVAPINEGVLQTSQSGTSGGSSAQLYYCNANAVTNKAIRILGYVEISETAAGTWATGPTYVQLFGPGIKKPGDVMQSVSPTPITTMTNLQTTQTQSAVTASITPTSAANVIEANCFCSILLGLNGAAVLQFSRGTSPTLFGSAAFVGSASSPVFSLQASVYGIDIPNTTSSTTYYIYGQTTVNSNATVNGVGTYNPSSVIVLKEIMSALEPANDDQPIRMVG